MSSSSTTQPTILYVADPKADLVLRSSDGVEFLVRRVVLQVSSQLFDDMFLTGSDQQSQRDTTTGFPIVEIDVEADVLDLILRSVVRDQRRVDVLGMTVTLAER